MVVVVVVVVLVLVVVVVVVVVGGGGGLILGEVKARPKDIISFSLDYISKSKVQTSNPSSSPIPLDTPARPADFHLFSLLKVELFEAPDQPLKHRGELKRRLINV